VKATDPWCRPLLDFVRVAKDDPRCDEIERANLQLWEDGIEKAGATGREQDRFLAFILTKFSMVSENYN
jgi:hypothetical protein